VDPTDRRALNRLLRVLGLLFLFLVIPTTLAGVFWDDWQWQDVLGVLGLGASILAVVGLRYWLDSGHKRLKDENVRLYSKYEQYDYYIKPFPREDTREDS
jgi:hypothetical protein